MTLTDIKLAGICCLSHLWLGTKCQKCDSKDFCVMIKSAVKKELNERNSGKN